ncbi:hypothetical protein PG995_009170 [Apiospora arundinis]
MTSKDHPIQRKPLTESPRQDLSNLVSSYSQNNQHQRERTGSGLRPFPPYNQTPDASNKPSPPPPTVGTSFSSMTAPLPYRPPRTSTPERRLIGPAPPQPEPGMSGFPAPRLYHRMMTEYETIKTIFYMAKSQPSHNELSPLAGKLKFLSREIWNLRYSRASEFPYSEAVTEERITEWKVQYDYWSDVLEDLLDPRHVARTELEKSEDDWAGVAGLASAPGAVEIARPAMKKKAAAAEAPRKKVFALEEQTVGQERAATDSSEPEEEEAAAIEAPVSILKRRRWPSTRRSSHPKRRRGQRRKRASEWIGNSLKRGLAFA